jgi:hypothetical protein
MNIKIHCAYLTIEKYIGRYIIFGGHIDPHTTKYHEKAS